MKRINRISPRKEPVQKRSLELRESIITAATYVLRDEGIIGFTTNRVAERAGVNIASLYQYYPNKESLLFHLVEIEWNTTFEAIFPILRDKKKKHRERLQLFIETFYQSEIDEKSLSEAIRAVGIAIEDTQEYLKLISKGDKCFEEFLKEALPLMTASELKKTSAFIQNLIFGFADGLEVRNTKDLKEVSKTMTEMIASYFKIN